MRIVAALAVVALLVPLALAGGAPPAGNAPPGAAAAPAVLPLREATRKGLLRAEGVRPASYQKVTLRIRSLSDLPVTVNLTGSYLRPLDRGSCQRLGLGPEVTPTLARHGPHGQNLVTVPAGKRVELRLNTVCLDAGREAPATQTFDVARDPLPPVREKVVRWWVDHPDAPQDAVNCAIWQNRDQVRIAPGVVPGYEKPKGTFGALLGGTAYRIHDGELLSFDGNGIVRFLGTEIFQALPTSGALYAIGLGEDRKPELWRFALTGDEPWGRVMDLDLTERVKRVITPGKDRLVLVTDRGVRIVDTKNDRAKIALDRQRILDLTTRQAGPDRLTVVLRVPASSGYYQKGELKGATQDVFELWNVDLGTGRAVRIERYWNVRSIAAGKAGVYGLTHVGGLRELVGKRFRDMPPKEKYDRLLAVGRKSLWLTTPDGRLTAANARTGVPLFVTKLKIDEKTAVSIDPVTDDLAVVRGGVFDRVTAKDGTVERIGPASGK